MIKTQKVRISCDHPGCIRDTSVEDEQEAKDHGWTLRLPDRGSAMPHIREDFCPDHGRCSWCHERKPRKSLTPGAGECEGHLICGQCIIRREG